MTLTRILAERLTTPENARRKVSLYRVFVRDLVVSCSIGVHAHEHDASQRVRINVDLWAEESPSPVDDDIANVVSYEDIVTGIETLLGKGHINLVETAAEDIAALCLKDRRVVKARVRVEKLDVFDNTASVGVEIERGRGAAPPPGAFQAVPPRSG